MERPNKEDYDFNDVFEAVRFASNMIKYADYLEAKQLPIPVVVVQSEQLKAFLDKHYEDHDNWDEITPEHVDEYIKRL
jgi:hypothetical protein